MAVGKDALALASLAGAGQTRRIFTAEIPKALVIELECVGLVVRSKTLMSSVVGS